MMKIELDKFTPSYITPEYVGWINDHNINTYLCTGRMPTDAKDLFAPEDNANYIFAIICDNRYIGTASLHRTDWVSKKTEIGYMIGNQNYWGNGIATEVVKLLTDRSFNILGLNKITADVVSTNNASINVLKKNNYIHYATSPQDYYLNGEYLDSYLFYRLSESKI